MRATLNDLLLLVRYVLPFRTDQRWLVCERLCKNAEIAAEHMCVTGRVHALYGDGSVGSAALRSGLAPLPALLDRDTLNAVQCVITVLADHLPDAQDEQCEGDRSNARRAAPIVSPRSLQ